MLSINFNPSLLKTQNILNIANNSLSTSLQRLSTGMRVNSADDDPAGYYVASGLNSQIRGLKQAQNNIAVGSSLLGTAEGALNDMTDMLNRLNDLALQGASTSMTESARSALVTEANALVEEIKKINTDTEFNGTKVFGNGSVAPITTGTVPAGYTAIYTAADLNKLRSSSSQNTAQKYILMNDINMSSIENWEPIGTATHNFYGVFDGNGHVIKNLKIDKTTNYVGLFGVCAGKIKNVGLINADVSGGNYTGGLVGKITNGGAAYNCFVKGTVKGEEHVGGLAGEYAGLGNTSIENSYCIANVTGKLDVGGLVGLIQRGTITNSYAKGSISGDSEIGGIVGKSNSAKITNCYSSVEIETPEASNLGLICGYVNSLTTNDVYANKTADINAFGYTNGTTENIKNTSVLNKNDFNSGETWADFDSSIWDNSSVPPRLKNMPQVTYNFYSENTVSLQVGTGSDADTNTISVDTGFSLEELEINLSTVDDCLDSSVCVKAALDAIAQKSSDIGVAQSRLETISNTNTANIENLSAAYSAVTAADEAEEIVNYTKSQIMASTASSLITQTQYFQANLLLKLVNSLG